jgi:hypothetical protein
MKLWLITAAATTGSRCLHKWLTVATNNFSCPSCSRKKGRMPPQMRGGDPFDSHFSTILVPASRKESMQLQVYKRSGIRTPGTSRAGTVMPTSQCSEL